MKVTFFRFHWVDCTVALVATLLLSQSSRAEVSPLARTDNRVSDSNTLVQIGADPYSNSEAQHQTTLEPHIMSSGNTLVSAYMVARLNSGGASGIGWATSQDGGQTWKKGEIPNTTSVTGGNFEFVTDPVVAFDAKHGVWMISYIATSSTDSWVAASYSRDGGVNWSSPQKIASGNNVDKNWTTCDTVPSSPHYGNCYTLYVEQSEDEKVYNTRSTDGGQTWSSPLPTQDNAQGIAGVQAIGPNGTVSVIMDSTDYKQILSYHSTDGGASWSNTSTLADIKGNDSVAGLRAYPNPTVTVDPNGSGQYFASWSDCRFRSNCDGNDLVLTQSKDGITWSEPQRINAGQTGTDHRTLPAAAFDPISHQLGILYYSITGDTCSNDPTTCEIAPNYISSSDNGATWSGPRALATPFKPDLISTTARGTLLGDYYGVAFSNGIPFPVFALALQPNPGQQYRQEIFTLSKPPMGS